MEAELIADDVELARATSLMQRHQITEALQILFARLQRLPDDWRCYFLAAQAVGGIYYSAKTAGNSLEKADFPFNTAVARQLCQIGRQIAPNDKALHLTECALNLRDAVASRNHRAFDRQMAQTVPLLDERNRRQAASVARKLQGNDLPLFIHIPKCGGSSLANSRRFATIGHRYFRDADAAAVDVEGFLYGDSRYGTTMPLSPRRPVFVAIRHILDLLASYHRYLQTSDHYLVPDVGLASRLGLDDFVKALADRDDAWPGRRLLYFPLFAQPSGRLAVDYVGRTEALAADAAACLATFGLDADGMFVPHVNRSRCHRHSSHLYADSTLELISRVWARDIRLFGFDLSGGYRTTGAGTLLGDVRAWRDEVAYSLTEDRLFESPSGEKVDVGAGRSVRVEFADARAVR